MFVYVCLCICVCVNTYVCIFKTFPHLLDVVVLGFFFFRKYCCRAMAAAFRYQRNPFLPGMFGFALSLHFLLYGACLCTVPQ